MPAVATQSCQFAVAKSTWSQMFDEKPVTMQPCGKEKFTCRHVLADLALTVES